MLDIFRLWNLFIFGEGGDGAAEGDADGDAGEDIPSSIPARAKERYRAAVAKHRGSHEASNVEANVPQTNEDDKPSHVPFAELIKSDEYKDEHKAYMDKTISDRLKKYKGLEEKSSKQDALLGLVAQKYGIDASADDFLEVLGKSIEEDDSYYEKYAMENDISATEARKIVTLERKVAEQERVKRQQEEERVRRERIETLNRNAQITKARFPEFDLQTELQNEKFMRLCAVNNGDTTAAYMAVHWGDILSGTAQMAQQRAAEVATKQVTASVKANQKRPVEAGIGGRPSSVQGEEDFSRMNLQQLREYAAQQRRRR